MLMQAFNQWHCSFHLKAALPLAKRLVTLSHPLSILQTYSWKSNIFTTNCERMKCEAFDIPKKCSILGETFDGYKSWTAFPFVTLWLWCVSFFSGTCQLIKIIQLLLNGNFLHQKLLLCFSFGDTVKLCNVHPTILSLFSLSWCHCLICDRENPSLYSVCSPTVTMPRQTVNNFCWVHRPQICPCGGFDFFHNLLKQHPSLCMHGFILKTSPYCFQVLPISGHICHITAWFPLCCMCRTILLGEIWHDQIQQPIMELVI